MCIRDRPNDALAALLIDCRCSVADAADLGEVVVQPANSSPATPIVAAAMPARRKRGKLSNMELSLLLSSVNHSTGPWPRRKAHDVINETKPTSSTPCRNRLPTTSRDTRGT